MSYGEYYKKRKRFRWIGDVGYSILFVVLMIVQLFLMAIRGIIAQILKMLNWIIWQIDKLTFMD